MYLLASIIAWFGGLVTLVSLGFILSCLTRKTGAHYPAPFASAIGVSEVGMRDLASARSICWYLNLAVGADSVSTSSALRVSIGLNGSEFTGAGN